MIKTRWTRAPWKLDGLLILSTIDDAYVCEIKLADDDPEVIANAYLLRAAPELYDALTEANAFILAPAEDVREHVLSRIRAVLSLARGESAS